MCLLYFIMLLSIAKGEKKNGCRFLVGKPEGKRPLGRCRYKWRDNSKVDLAQSSDKWRALVNMVVNLQVP
jgi:hypothetical protein